MSNPNEMTDIVGTHPVPFSIHAEVPANKDRALNPSCPLSYCNRAVHFIKPCANATNRPKDRVSNPNERTYTADTHPAPFSTHAEVAAKKDRARNPSCPCGLTYKAVRFIQPCLRRQNGPKQMSNPNEMTDAVGTIPDLFCIHAEVPANKKEGRDPSHS